MGQQLAEALETTIAPILKEIRDEAGVEAVNQLSGGGMVQYRKAGGLMNSIFKPKGTDTVPAMLTPGEFVVRKSAVDKIGVGTLSALNNGNVSSVAKSAGGTIYRAQGGVVNLPAAGALQQGFISQLSGKAGPIFGALKDGFGMDDKEARKASIYIRDLSKKGIINATNMQGGIQLENINRAIRDSSFISGILPTTIRGVDFGAELAGVDAGWPPSKAELENIKKALHKARQRSSSLFADHTNISKAVAGGLDTPPAKFASSLLQRSGLLKLNPMDEYGKISQELFAHATKSKTESEKYDVLFDKVKTIFDGTPAKPVMDTREPPWEQLYKKLSGVAKAGQAADQKAAKAAEDGAVGALGLKGADQNKLKYLLSKNIIKMAQGGSVAGSDTVPAMLTPGEFVMSKGSVNQYGTGFMSSLNKGRVPGFARGGLVGGGVQYKQNGGEVGDGAASIIIDPSGLQEVLNNFNATFQSSIDSLVTQFSSFSESMNGLASAIQGGMTLTHNFSGDMSLAFKIENADHLKKVIADAITPRLSEIISSELDSRLNKDFRAG